MRTKIILAIMAMCVLLTGCRTQTIIETKIVRDSIFQTRDSIVYRLIKDSVSEREKTVILTKRDTIKGIDSVFVTKERYVDRWKIRTDTIQRKVYIKMSKDEKVKDEIKPKSKLWTEKLLSKRFFLICAMVWAAAYTYFRLRNR